MDWIGYGMGWVGWDLCAGLLYEHRFAMLIISKTCGMVLRVKHLQTDFLTRFRHRISGKVLTAGWAVRSICKSHINLHYHYNALLPSGSPFGDPGPHGDLFQILGPQNVPIFFQGPHYLHFRLKNKLKVRAATIY